MVSFLSKLEHRQETGNGGREGAAPALVSWQPLRPDIKTIRRQFEPRPWEALESPVHAIRDYFRMMARVASLFAKGRKLPRMIVAFGLAMVVAIVAETMAHRFTVEWALKHSPVALAVIFVGLALSFRLERLDRRR